MRIGFVTPLGALFALTALLPLAVFVARGRRLAEIRSALGLEQRRLRSELPVLLALGMVPALLGLAAAQPVIETTRTVPERTDAQAFVVLDVSRSMLAAQAPGARTRFERAREIALRLRDRLPEVPFGVASLTSGVLPHLFPTTDGSVFAATLAKAVDPRRPPPSASFLTLATNLNGLHAVPDLGYFPPSATKRVLVVLTDGETQPPESQLSRSFNRRPRVQTVFVRLWAADERIYEAGVVEGGYRPDPRSDALLARTALLVGGEVFAEADASQVVAAVRTALGEGPTVARKHDSGRLALMPYLALCALLPLLVVLARRNVWLPRRPAIRPSQRRKEVGETPAPRFGSAFERV